MPPPPCHARARHGRRRRGRAPGPGDLGLAAVLGCACRRRHATLVPATAADGVDAHLVPGDPHAHNRLKHLKAHRPSSHKAVLAEAENFRSCTKKPKLCTSTLNGVQMSKPALQLHCLRLVTEGGLSFKVLDYPALQDIIRPLINAMPSADRFTISSKTIPDQIPEFAEMVRERIRSEVKGKMVSLKVDGCTKKHRYFVGINIQFELDGELVVRTLAVEEMLQAATSNNLRILLGIVLKNFRIEPRLQLVAFTVDSGANYVLAGKLLADLQIDEDEDEEAADADVGSAGDGAGSEDGPEDESEADWLESDIELRHDDFCMQGVRCACHTLQLAVGDALKVEKALLDLWDRMQLLQDPNSPPEPESEEDTDSPEDAQVLSDEDEGASLFLGLLERKNKERLVATGAMESAAGTRSRSKTSRRAALRILLDEHDRATPPLSATANIFAYWKEKKFANPELYALAMVVLTIPASQVSVERLFSGLRFILRPQRFGLSSAHVDDVMFLNANKDVVQSVVQDLLRKAPREAPSP